MNTATLARKSETLHGTSILRSGRALATMGAATTMAVSLFAGPTAQAAESAPTFPSWGSALPPEEYTGAPAPAFADRFDAVSVAATVAQAAVDGDKTTVAAFVKNGFGGASLPAGTRIIGGPTVMMPETFAGQSDDGGVLVTVLRFGTSSGPLDVTLFQTPQTNDGWFVSGLVA